MTNFEKQISVRVSLVDHERWQTLAQEEQRRLADWVRIVVNKVVDEEFRKRSEQEQDAKKRGK
jgi:hypothetical protein